ncbi:MAG TPA: 16S rRNA (guanine(966)-N(2))-methyltransferase RsmD [Blastocatellia bacterium]
MRVIAGQYGGRKLRTLSGLDTRPTSDRLRETLFNVLAPRIGGCAFLDLCAGSGAVGIEALSRGATSLVSVEHSGRACGVIKENLKLLGLSADAEILNRDVISAVRYLAENAAKFDIIYLDPPYDSDLYSHAITMIRGGRLLSDEGILVVEHRTKNALAPDYGELVKYREIRQGDSAIAFYEARPSGPPMDSDRK